MKEKQLTIEQMNEAIALFDGWEPRLSEKGQHSKTPLWYKTSAGYAAWDLSAMKYHNDWNWLMPVVEKIEQCGYLIEITFGVAATCRIWNHKYHISNTEHNSPIMAVYNAVYEFVQWYNQKTK